MHPGRGWRAPTAVICAVLIAVAAITSFVTLGGIATATATDAIHGGAIEPLEASFGGTVSESSVVGRDDQQDLLEDAARPSGQPAVGTAASIERLSLRTRSEGGTAVVGAPGHHVDTLARQQTGPSTTVFGQDATFGFMELSSVFFGEGSRFFGPNDTIAVSGQIPPAWSCPTTNKGILREPAPFPTADFYVIENTGDYLQDGSNLEDVGTQPNRVVALSSGAFVDELVAVAQPSGNLPPGEYDIVMDQCMNGVLDRAGQEMSESEFLTARYDIVLGDGPGFAFKVMDDGTVAENLPEVDTHRVKESAKTMGIGLGGTEFENPATGEVEQVPGFCGAKGALKATAKKKQKRAKNTGNKAQARRLGRLRSVLTVAIAKCRDMIKHYEGIVADPPRSDYDELAEVGPVDYNFSPTETPLERATQRLSNRFAEQAAITEALLITMERFQGAKAANDHEAMVRQLERMDELITLLIGPGGNLYRTYAALEAFELALQDDPDVGNTTAADEVRAKIPELRRGIGGLLEPLGPRIRHDKEDDELIPIGLQAWINVYLGDEFLASEGLLGIPQLRKELGLPPLSVDHPSARTTGPYTAPPNRSLELAAGLSEDPNGDPLTFAWDLDGDGAFDDADGVVVNASFEEPGTRLIGVRASDSDGNEDVHYTLLRIGDLTTQEVVVTNGGSSSVKTLWQVSPEGEVSVIRDGAPIPGNLGGFQVDVNGDIVVAADGFGRSVIQRFDANGTLIRTISEEQVEAHIGRGIDHFDGLVIDGRGDIIVTARPDPSGPHMLIRIAPDGSRASVIRGVLSQGPDPHAVHSGLAIDPDGNIVVGGGGLPDGNITEIVANGGVVVVDPDNGSAVMSIPPTGYRDPAGTHHTVLPTFGGKRLFFSLGGNFEVDSGGIAVDDRGNYISGYLRSVIPFDLFRIPVPPELTVRSESDTSVEHGLEIFPLVVSDDETLNLVGGDIAIDRGGDVLVPGQDFSVLPVERKGVWRVTPEGTAFLMANLTPHQTRQSRNFRPDKLAVVPEVRRVTPKDVPPPPSLRITDLRVDQEACPGSVQLGVTVTNTGSGPAEPPISVAFFDGDPLADGVAVGSAEATEPIAPGESVELDVTWSGPAPGPHQVFARAMGGDANTPFTALRVCGAEGVSHPVTLAPTTATKSVGDTQTLEATVEVLGEPVEGLPITFEVTGANPEAATIDTDETGVATFTYTGTEAGDDTIVATVASATVVRTAPAHVTWLEETNRPPEADAGGPYEATEGGTLTLNGTGSSDPDGDALNYTWAFEGRTFDGAIATIPAVDDLETTATLTVDDGRDGVDSALANVTVSNVPPGVAAGDDQHVEEGSSVTLSASFTDPGIEDAPWNVTWKLGDGSDPVTVTTDTTGDLAIDHVYVDDGEYEAEVCVTDKDGESGCDSLVVTVLNVPPVITALNRSTPAIDEGDEVTLFGSFTDPGSLDTHRVTVAWGDGSEDTLELSLDAREFSLNHSYLDNRPDDAPYPISVQVMDDDGGEDDATTQVTVRNVAPDVTALARSNATIQEGDEVVLSGGFTDPGLLDTHHVTFDWGDGNSPEMVELLQGDREFARAHVYLDNPPGEPRGSYDVNVTVTDNDADEGSNATAVQVVNVPPNVTDLTPTETTIKEGDAATLSGAFSDPGMLDTHDVVVDWGDGSDPQTLNLSRGDRTFTVSHRYLDNPPGEPDGSYDVSVTVTDKDGGEDTATTAVHVLNVRPDVSATGDAIDEGETASIQATFTDPGVLDTHTATVDWGDGTPPEAVAVDKGAGSGNLTATHTYGDDGTYRVTVTVIDDDGGVGTATAVVEVANVAPTVDLNTSEAIAFHEGAMFLGRVGAEQSHEATATDVGSDDLVFTWDFQVNTTSATYFNDGEHPDPDLSPAGTFPFSATDGAAVTFAEPGVYSLGVKVVDDDGGADDTGLSKVVTGDAPSRRSMGFWRHQYSGNGKPHHSEENLTAFLDIVDVGSGVFHEEVPVDSFEAALDVLEPRGPSMRIKAEAQALAAWLNFASGRVGWTEEIDVDGDGIGDRAFRNVMSEVESILLDVNATEHELKRAKDLAEAVNAEEGDKDDDGEGDAGGDGKGDSNRRTWAGVRFPAVMPS